MRENGRIQVNGIGIYYEVHGRADGIPVVLLPATRYPELTAGLIEEFLAIP